MLVPTLWSHVRGYVIIRAKGGPIEAFINGAVADGVPLWRLERAAPRLLVARAEARSFSRLARIGRRLGVRVTAVKKGGVPFVLVRARRRRAFVVGGLLFVALLYWLAQFVWLVDVQGAEEIGRDKVLAAAARAGLRPGARRADVRRDAVVYGLHRDVAGIAWVGVELRGAAAVLRVVQRTEVGASGSEPGHIVAAEAGLVERVVVTRGTALVAPGDTVLAGQPLISGMLPPGGDAHAERLAAEAEPVVRAEGAVWGRVWYRGFAEVSLPDGDDLSVAAARDFVRAVAEDAVDGRLPAEAEQLQRDVSVEVEGDGASAVVRATVTVSVQQNLGRFLPAPGADADGDGLKDEADGAQDGQFQRPN